MVYLLVGLWLVGIFGGICLGLLVAPLLDRRRKLTEDDKRELRETANFAVGRPETLSEEDVEAMLFAWENAGFEVRRKRKGG